MECQEEKFYLVLSSIFTASMWVLSEIIGSSKCKPNGVFEFVVTGFCIEVKRTTNCPPSHQHTFVNEENPLLD